MKNQLRSFPLLAVVVLIVDYAPATTPKESQSAMDVVVNTRMPPLAAKSLDGVLRKETLKHVQNAQISLVQD